VPLRKVFPDFAVQAFSYIFDPQWSAGKADSATDYLYPGESAGFTMTMVNPYANDITVNHVYYSISSSATNPVSNTDYDHNFACSLPITHQNTGIISINPIDPTVIPRATGTYYLLIWVECMVAGSDTHIQDSRPITIKNPETPVMYFDVNGVWETPTNLNSFICMMYRDVASGDKGPGKVEIDGRVHNYARCPITFDPLHIDINYLEGQDTNANMLAIYDKNGENSNPQIFVSTAGVVAAHSDQDGSFYIQMTSATVLPKPDPVLTGLINGAWGATVAAISGFLNVAKVGWLGFLGGAYDIFAGIIDQTIAETTIANANAANLYSLT